MTPTNLAILIFVIGSSVVALCYLIYKLLEKR